VDLAGVPLDATRRIPFVISGQGCEVTRTKIAGGWTPGPTFATHSDVGFNELCSPTAMREWLVAAPGEYLPRDANKRAWEGGSMSVSLAMTTSAAGRVTEGVAVAPLCTADRIAELTPPSDSELVVPAWLAHFATVAPAGEAFWA
jgi:hypothetical protein